MDSTTDMDRCLRVCDLVDKVAEWDQIKGFNLVEVTAFKYERNGTYYFLVWLYCQLESPSK